MKNQIMKLLLIPSGIALMLSLSGADKVELVLFSLIGLAFGILLCFLKVEGCISANRVEYIVGMVLAVILCVMNSKYFFNTWAESSTVKSLLSHLFSDPMSGLIVLCAIVGLADFPILAYIMVIAITWLVRACKILKPKKMLSAYKENNSLGIFLRRTAIVLINLAIAASAGTFLLFVVYCLPVDSIELHVRSSAVTIQEEGTYPQLYSWCQSQLDNYTDSIMLLEAVDATEAPALEKAMLAYRGSLDNCNPAETLTAHYVQDVEFSGTTSYARYWHGYLVILKPLLHFFDYNTIRIINSMVQLGTLLVVCVLMSWRGLKSYIVPYLLCYLALMPVALAKSLQFSSCYYVFSAGVIALLLLKDSMRERYCYLVFLNIGIAIAYFDFLTYPIATFGIPAIMYITLNRADFLEEKLVGIMRNGFLWCLGYGGMWGAKWIIASIATDNNVFVNAMGAFATRISTVSSDGLTQYSIFNCEIDNYTSFIKTPFIILVIAFCFYVLSKHMRYHSLKSENVIATSFPYVLLSFAPIVWYAFATNHSSVHYWFTNKAFVVTLAAMLFGITDLTQSNFIFKGKRQ